jgi:hypothetical protein
MLSAANAERTTIKITGQGLVDDPRGFGVRWYEKEVTGLTSEQGKLLESWLIKRLCDDLLVCVSINDKEEKNGKTNVLVRFCEETGDLRIRTNRTDEMHSALIATVIDMSLEKLSMYKSGDWPIYTTESFFSEIGKELKLAEAKRK